MINVLNMEVHDPINMDFNNKIEQIVPFKEGLAFAEQDTVKETKKRPRIKSDITIGTNVSSSSIKRQSVIPRGDSLVSKKSSMLSKKSLMKSEERKSK